MASLRLLLALLAACALAACDGTPEEPEDTSGPPSSGVLLPGFRVTLGSPHIEVHRGTQAVLPVMLSRWGGFTGNVAVNATSAPPGVSVLATVIPQGRDSSALRISAGAAADTGLTKLTLITSAISMLDSVHLELRVLPAVLANKH